MSCDIWWLNNKTSCAAVLKYIKSVCLYKSTWTWWLGLLLICWCSKILILNLHTDCYRIFLREKILLILYTLFITLYFSTNKFTDIIMSKEKFGKWFIGAVGCYHQKVAVNGWNLSSLSLILHEVWYTPFLWET